MHEAVWDSVGGFCLSCLCLWPDEAHRDQKQPLWLNSRNPVASAFDSMKLTKLKGNHHATKAKIQLPLPLTLWNSTSPKATISLQKQEFSCLRLWLDEAHQDQRQPSCYKSKNSVASAFEPMKLATNKGNHRTTKARIQLPPPFSQWNSPRSKATIVPQKQESSCLRLWLDETHLGQRQPPYHKSKNSVAYAFDSMKLTESQGNHRVSKQEFSCLCINSIKNTHD